MRSWAKHPMIRRSTRRTLLIPLLSIRTNANPYFPLVQGYEWVYEGGGETITVTVTEETKEILGVKCRVVKDVVTE